LSWRSNVWQNLRSVDPECNRQSLSLKDLCAVGFRFDGSSYNASTRRSQGLYSIVGVYVTSLSSANHGSTVVIHANDSAGLPSPTASASVVAASKVSFCCFALALRLSLFCASVERCFSVICNRLFRLRRRSFSRCSFVWWRRRRALLNRSRSFRATSRAIAARFSALVASSALVFTARSSDERSFFSNSTAIA